LLLLCARLSSPMLNNYVGISCLALCAYLFVNHLLHLFRVLLLLRRFVLPIQ
jgi:hypothetical protein